MPLTIVIGGQYGSEGKGKVAHYFAQKLAASYVVRCGGSNSGHTVITPNGKTCIFRHLPTAAILPDTKLCLCAGSYIDTDVLLSEISDANIDHKRLLIDPFAVIITDECIKEESESGLISNIGSTGSGTGAAVISRIARNTKTVFAKDEPELSKYIHGSVSQILRKALDKNEHILIEGTQGFGLSPFHSGYNPKVTSRDTIAAAFLAETGLSPKDVNEIVMVIRAFPIRVPGESGELPNEISWEKITDDGQHDKPIIEYTSVTNGVRRIAEFHPDIVKKAIIANKPTKIVLNHVDYFGKHIVNNEKLLLQHIHNIEDQIGCKIDYYGDSPSSVIAVKGSFDDAHIPSGMLSSPQIREYINNGKLIYIPNDNDREKLTKQIKPATFDMRLGKTAVRFERGIKKVICLGEFEKRYPKTYTKLTFPPNSLTFVTTYEHFNLPKNIIARFNLKVKFVHMGLLLGTGPIVDPEYNGPLYIPIHNFSSQPVEIDFMKSLISVEFTKTLPTEHNYVNNEHPTATLDDFLEKNNIIESSVFNALETTRALTDKYKRYLSWGSVGGFIGLIALVISVCSVLNSTNARIDNIKEPSIITEELNQIKYKYKLLEDRINRIKPNELESIPQE